MRNGVDKKSSLDTPKETEDLQSNEIWISHRREFARIADINKYNRRVGFFQARAAPESGSICDSKRGTLSRPESPLQVSASKRPLIRFRTRGNSFQDALFIRIPFSLGKEKSPLRCYIHSKPNAIPYVRRKLAHVNLQQKLVHLHLPLKPFKSRWKLENGAGIDFGMPSLPEADVRGGLRLQFRQDLVRGCGRVCAKIPLRKPRDIKKILICGRAEGDVITKGVQRHVLGSLNSLLTSPRRKWSNVFEESSWQSPSRVTCSNVAFNRVDGHIRAMERSAQCFLDRGKQILARCGTSDEYEPKWTYLEMGNMYVGNARSLLTAEDFVVGEKCSCHPENSNNVTSGKEHVLACSDDRCENRAMQVECVPETCPAGSYCRNQRLRKMQDANFEVKKAPGKGFGLFARERIGEGTFIGEYLGEVISQDLFEMRKRQYEGEHSFYFMTLTKNLVIDASRKSGLTRFLNHSCDPNAETEKWNSCGEPRIAVVAKRDIQSSEEITLCYGEQSRSANPVLCLCESPRCRGWLMPPDKSKISRPLQTTGRLSNGSDLKADMEKDPTEEKLRLATRDLKTAELLFKRAERTILKGMGRQGEEKRQSQVPRAP